METLAQHLKVLGDPTRLRLLALLVADERCVCELTEVLALPQSTVSRHLAVLRSAGWINGERRGKWMYYRLQTPPSDSAQTLLQALCSLLLETEQARRDQHTLKRYLTEKKLHRCD